MNDFTIENGKLMKYSGQDPEVIIPNSVTSIDDDAFKNCDFITSICVPKTVKKIGGYFYSKDFKTYYINIAGFFYRKYVSEYSEEFEKIYAQARVDYTIIYQVDDWADDDTDWGMGYTYNNSYTLHREPLRKELIIKDGKVSGFVVDEIDNRLLVGDKRRNSASNGDNDKRYGNSETWTLVKSLCISKYLWIPGLNAPSQDYRFTVTNFDSKLVKSVVKQIPQEDLQGDFNGYFNVTVELTEQAIKNPDGTLEEFSKRYKGCTLVKKF